MKILSAINSIGTYFRTYVAIKEGRKQTTVTLPIIIKLSTVSQTLFLPRDRKQHEHLVVDTGCTIVYFNGC